MSSTCQQMKMTSTVSTNRMEPVVKGHTTNKHKKCITSAWIHTFFKHPTFTVKKCESILTHILIYNYWNWQRLVSPLDPHPPTHWVLCQRMTTSSTPVTPHIMVRNASVLHPSKSVYLEGQVNLWEQHSLMFVLVHTSG